MVVIITIIIIVVVVIARSFSRSHRKETTRDRLL